MQRALQRSVTHETQAIRLGRVSANAVGTESPGARTPVWPAACCSRHERRLREAGSSPGGGHAGRASGDLASPATSRADRTRLAHQGTCAGTAAPRHGTERVGRSRRASAARARPRSTSQGSGQRIPQPAESSWQRPPSCAKRSGLVLKRGDISIPAVPTNTATDLPPVAIFVSRRCSRGLRRALSSPVAQRCSRARCIP